MISSRYATPVCVLLILALIPTLIHNYMGDTANDGKSAQNIATTFNNFSSTPTSRKPFYGKEMFDSDDWFERDYVSNNMRKIKLFTMRGYDHKRIYHHPELAISYGRALETMELESLLAHPEIPVHILVSDDKSLLVAYVLLFDGEGIADPIKHQLKDSIRLLAGSRKPITLFYASQAHPDLNEAFKDSDIAALLAEVIDDFQSQ
ncbi:MAG: hypothetical protein GQ582_00050, partial [Methyloprofundus sp.]|nr:hypothetical protein [Methyloprofundus sp.]